MSKKVVVPPNEDPIQWFERYKRRQLWQRRDWRKGLIFGGGLMFVVATLLKILGVI